MPYNYIINRRTRRSVERIVQNEPNLSHMDLGY